jgi:hypothetical protein
MSLNDLVIWLVGSGLLLFALVGFLSVFFPAGDVYALFFNLI